VCELPSKFFATSVWQPAQVSEPTKSPVADVCADCVFVVLVSDAGFTSCAALHATLDATANPSKQTPSKRNPHPDPSGFIKWFAPGIFCITGFVSFICFFPFPCNPVELTSELCSQVNELLHWIKPEQPAEFEPACFHA
jgi:hypothetical protein